MGNASSPFCRRVQFALNHPFVDGYGATIVTVTHMEMRWIVIIAKHGYNDTEESALMVIR